MSVCSVQCTFQDNQDDDADDADAFVRIVYVKENFRPAAGFTMKFLVATDGCLES